jgi:hypothetical protein
MMTTKQAQKAQREQERRDQLVSGLRELADLYEKNSTLPLPYGVSVQLDVTVRKSAGTPDKPWETVVDEEATKRAVKRAIRGMGRGRKDKVYSDYSFIVNKQLTPMVLLQMQTTRGAVCHKVPTGRTIVHPAQHYTTDERVEEEYEWVCDDPVFAEPKKEVAA